MAQVKTVRVLIRPNGQPTASYVVYQQVMSPGPGGSELRQARRDEEPRLDRDARGSRFGLILPDPQRPRAADAVLHQVERHGIADGKIVERRGLADVAAVKPDVPTVRDTNEAEALADAQSHDAAADD